MRVRNFALLLIGAAALSVPVVAAKGAEQATGEPLILQGKCASAGEIRGVHLVRGCAGAGN